MRLLLILCALGTAAAGSDVRSLVERHSGEIQADESGRVRLVRLPYAWVTDSDMEAIAALRDVRTLDLSLSLITDAGMEHLKPLENVTDLNLFAVELITDVAIAYIRGWRKLERLNLRGTDITDTTLEYVGSIPSLRSLDVSYTQITNNGLEHLAALPNLEELTLGGNKVTGAGLRGLKAMPALRRLSLNGAQKRNSGTWSVSLTDLDLDAIAGLQRLEALDLGGVKLTDAGVTKLTRLANLRELDLSRTQTSSEGLRKLGIRGLERLDLWRAKGIDDSAAEALAGMQKLALLDLAGTSFGDAGLEKLAANKSLRRLFLRDSRVTRAGIEVFRAAHPGCEVIWE
jgi:hypothetical protein